MKLTYLILLILLLLIGCKKVVIVPDEKLQKIIGEYNGSLSYSNRPCDDPIFNTNLGGGKFIINTTENPSILSVEFDKDYSVEMPNLNLKITGIDSRWIYFVVEGNEYYTDDCTGKRNFFNIDSPYHVSSCCNVDLVWWLRSVPSDSTYDLAVFGKHYY